MKNCNTFESVESAILLVCTLRVKSYWVIFWREYFQILEVVQTCLKYILSMFKIYFKYGINAKKTPMFLANQKSSEFFWKKYQKFKLRSPRDETP